MPAPDELKRALETHFAALVEKDEVDIVAVEDEDAVEVQTDTWTLYTQGWPLTTAWIALDDDAASPTERVQVLTVAVRPHQLAVLRALDAALTGALATALRASADPLSITLAGLIEAKGPS
ncbi:MAG TPA: hypothetical protein VM450_08900 [Thermomicrobiales bacterium]|nr:hypothetical protein [Thermomicrobiales bacterium]